jgi:DNA gyrase subunit A
MQYIKAPDFPTGGIIYGLTGVKEAFHTGRGRVVVRGRAEIQHTPSGREVIIISEIPYQVNKSTLVAKIAELMADKKIPGISDVRDESDRNGMRIVVEVRKDSMAQIVLSQLYKYTALQSSFGVNNVALVNGRPKILCLKEIIEHFIDFRIEVIVRRTQYDLRKAEERAHILEGLLIALDHLDEVIALIRASKTVDEARTGLMEQFELSEIQARAILDMRLQKLTGLEREKIKEEYEEIMKLIDHLKAILASEELQRQIIKDELTEIDEAYGDERRTDITAADGEISIEDMIKDEEVVITISHLGYIKRTPATEYRTQSRGGRGSKGSKTRDADFIEHLFVATNHNYLLLFTEQGRCHWLRVYEIPEAAKTAGGRVIQNILQIPKDDKVKAYIKIIDLTDEEFINNHFIIFSTRKGMVKKTAVEAFSRPRSNGINAITINEGDQLLEARLSNGESEIFLAAKNGNAIRFNEDNVRPMGRTAAGVKGITLNDDGYDEVVGMVSIMPEDIEVRTILVLSEKGYGKRTPIGEYRLTNRGGKGVKTLQVTAKNGPVMAIKSVIETDDLMVTTRQGIVIRIPVNDISVLGRATQGVKIIRLKEDEISDVTVVPQSEEEEDDTGSEEQNNDSTTESDENQS